MIRFKMDLSRRCKIIVAIRRGGERRAEKKREDGCFQAALRSWARPAERVTFGVGAHRLRAHGQALEIKVSQITVWLESRFEPESVRFCQSLVIILRCWPQDLRGGAEFLVILEGDLVDDVVVFKQRDFGV
jgi:hypothetical protein